MDFFKVHHEILDKPKIARVDPSTLGFWVLFLAVASRRTDRGTLPGDVEELALAVHRPAKDVHAAQKILLERGFLEWRDGVLHVHDWEDYQVETSTQRVRKWRASQRGETDETDETFHRVAKRCETDETPETLRGEEIRGENNPLFISPKGEQKKSTRSRITPISDDLGVRSAEAGANHEHDDKHEPKH